MAEPQIFTLSNASGLRARVLEYGAVLASLEVPDRDGNLADVTLGYDDLAGWIGDGEYFGATVGRFANRIARGRFDLDGVEHALATNNAPGGLPCHLHGGNRGFNSVQWKGVQTGQSVTLRYTSPEGEEGYPGTLEAEVTYELTDDDELIWQARASTDASTIVNLAHHSYWNLSGDPSTQILDHELTLLADEYLPTDAGLIPTGERSSVAGTPMDFREPTRIGARIHDAFEALQLAGGYDHAWVLRRADRESLPVRSAARLFDPKSGREMHVLTDQPAVQFYSGNFLSGNIVGKRGIAYGQRSGLALETEAFPNAPNQPHFPSTVLKKGETYQHRMVHRFTTR